MICPFRVEVVHRTTAMSGNHDEYEKYRYAECVSNCALAIIERPTVSTGYAPVHIACAILRLAEKRDI